MTHELGPDTALYDPLDLAHTGYPNERLAQARAVCPVSTPRERVHVVATHELVREVLAGPEKFLNRGNFTIVPDPPIIEDLKITEMDPPEHREFRTFLRQWFAPAELRKQQGRVEQIVADLLEDFTPGQSIEFIEEVARKIPARTVYALVGLPEADWSMIQHWGDVIHEHMPDLPDDLVELRSFFDYLRAALSERLAVGIPTRNDLIDGIVFAPGMGLEAAVTHVIQLLTAGTATTTSLMSNLLYELLQARENWERVVADPGLVPAAVEESLRHDAPLQFALRTVDHANTEIGGCPVLPGDRIVVSLHSANLDEAAWGADASEFKIDRAREQSIMSFGYGIHTCLGAPLARIEAQALLRGLIQRFPNLRLADAYARVAAPDPMLRRPDTLEVVL